MPRSTEKNTAPHGYMTPRAASELLGRSDQTIRKLVKAGKVKGAEVETDNGETRYYIAREAVDRMLAKKSLDNGSSQEPALRPDLAERYVQALETHNETLVAILQEMRDHAVRTDKRLEAAERPWWRRLLGI